MDLQSVFYVVSIVFMILSSVLLLGIIIALFYVKKVIADIHATIDEKISLMKQVATEPSALTRGTSAALFHVLSFFTRKVFRVA